MDRHRILSLLGGILTLAFAGVAALPDDVGAIEEHVFRAINNLPNWIELPGWPVMQVGAILFVPVLAAGCWARSHDWRLPTRIALAGGVAWLMVKGVKELVNRGRPQVFLSDINLRPAWQGLGFPSGHAAVAFALAVVLGSTLDRRWRSVVWAVAILAGLLRIYTAAHFPLDVVGGWGLGAAIGSIVELGWRRSAQRPNSSRPQTAEAG